MPQLEGPPLEMVARETELSVQMDWLQVWCALTPLARGRVWWPQGGRVSAGGCGKMCFLNCVLLPSSQESSCP